MKSSFRPAVSRPTCTPCKSARFTPGKSTAFTLVELLTVIAIIAILAAIIFPAFAGVQENVRRANCMDNMRKLYIAVKQYQQDNRQYPEFLFGPALKADGTLATGSNAGMTPTQIAADLRATLTDNTSAAEATRIRNVQANYSSSLYPNYINDLAIYSCPNNPTKDPNGTSSYAATRYIQSDPNDPNSITQSTISFYKWDSYDANAQVTGTPGSRKFDPTTATVRYSRVWIPLLTRDEMKQLTQDQLAMYKNQLVFRNPSSDTFLTMCSYHVNKGKIVVTWLNGTPKVLDERKLDKFQNGANYDLYKMTPTNYN